MVSINCIFIATLCSSLFAACLTTPTSRILGGVEASPEAFPYVASVRRDNIHVCGGSIIALNYILTAAHCVVQGSAPILSSRVSVRAGSTNQYAGGNIFSVAEIYINSLYESLINDVALLKLVLPLEIGPRVQIIALAQSVDAVEAGNTVIVAGWGRTATDGANAFKLQHGDATALSNADCEASIGFGYESTLCLQNKPGEGACNGDAGGPAVYDNKVVGVSNFVIGTCATKYPDVYARVSFFSSWIDSIINAE